MAKLTVLDIVQDIMSDMNSDNVSTVSATATSDRVTRIVRSTYEKMMAERDWPHLGYVGQLNALGDPTHPNYMKIPDGVKRVDFIKYDKKQLVTNPNHFLDVEYKTPEEFLQIVNSRNSNDAVNVTVITDFNGIPLNVRHNYAPTYWTSFDDIHIVFDSYNSSLETSLQASKTQCKFYKNTVWGPTILAHQVSTAYGLNDVIQVLDTATNIFYYYRCTIAGTTAAVAPAYSTVAGALQVDGTATFIVLGTNAVDGFIPDLPEHLFPLLVAQAKAQCFNKVKQVVDSQEERDAKRQRVSAQLHTYRQDGEKLRPSYGRK